MNPHDFDRYSRIGFDDFRLMALDKSLSKYEKIGTPDSYRFGKEEAIFNDILTKLPMLRQRGLQVLDIGPGCSDLPEMIIKWCVEHEHHLTLVDSAEMLSLLSNAEGVVKTAGRFPDCEQLFKSEELRFDVIIVYSVFHYVFRDDNPWAFMDKALSLLAPGGSLFIGDIPNVSKRKRFLASEAGLRFHQEFMQTSEPPTVGFNRLEIGNIDDAVVLAMLMRARGQGFDAYLLQQPPELPMFNRREDLLLMRP